MTSIIEKLMKENLELHENQKLVEEDLFNRQAVQINLSLFD
jgi:hypothetical protein